MSRGGVGKILNHVNQCLHGLYGIVASGVSGIGGKSINGRYRIAVAWS